MAENQRRTVSFSPDQVLMKQSDRGNLAWLLQEGEIALLRNTRRMANALVGDGGAAVEIIRRREFDKAHRHHAEDPAIADPCLSRLSGRRDVTQSAVAMRLRPSVLAR